MKIVMAVDKIGSAIHRLAIGVQKKLPHLRVVICDVHPKRPSPDQIERFKREIQDADVISMEYWKTGLFLLDLFPEIRSKPKILAHYNPYNLEENNWSDFQAIIVPNREMNKVLPKARLIPLAIDLNFFKFQREMPDSNKVLMVSSRIEGKKGILPVAEVCQELGYPMILVGQISDRDYFDKIMATGVVEFRERVSEDDLLKAYYESAIHVCNSIDGFESGTLPLLEAMATGVCVLTRNIGSVPDIFNDENMVVRNGQPEDKEELKVKLRELMEDKDKRRKMREIAWNSVKSRDSERRAVMYEKLFYELLYPNNDLVSVIIPTFNRKNILSKVIEGVTMQDWPAKEIVVVDDGSTDGTGEFVMALQTKSFVPIKYINTGTTNIYNLAYARNLGVISAVGDIVAFLDDRYYPERNWLSEMLKHLTPKTWVYGNKGTRKDFVENISMCYRQELIDAGMFNQSCPKYGFQSQELRVRFRRQGFKFKFAESAKVKSLIETKNKYRKRDEIIKSKNILWRMNMEAR